MAVARLLLVVVAAIPATAGADHAHHHDHGHAAGGGGDPPGRGLTAAVTVTAAQYTNRSFVGDYQGLEGAVRWARGRLSAMASVPVYRLTRNGAVDHGPGDVMGHGQVQLAGGGGGGSAGLGLAVSAPTGSQRDRLGMGHVMVMPGAWGSLDVRGVVIGASLGYGRALGADVAEHAHGTGPIVDPMNFEEITWAGITEVALSPAIWLAVRMTGAIALDDAGVDRAFGGTRVRWVEGRVSTTAELQFGLHGDPFNVRGVVETAIAF